MIINPYRYAAAGGGGKRYWRIQITANNGDSFYCIQEVEFRLSGGGADVTTTSTPVTASSTLGGYPATLMVDNNTTNDQNVWVSASAPGTVNLVFDLGSGQNIAELAIMPQNNAGVGPGRAPKDFTIASSPDNSTWTTEKTVTNSTGWTAGVYRNFSIP